jgi:hypothetical protein
MSKKKKDVFDVIRGLISQKELDKLSENLIITVPGGYELFGQYLISKKKVGYKVTKYNTALSEHFYSLQNATIFSILHKRDKIVGAKRILELDVLLENANAEIERHKQHGAKAKDNETKLIAFSKYEEARHKKKIYGSEVAEYLAETKSWQETRYREAVK